MKRHGNLFERAFSPENLYDAYLDARRGKRGRRACFNFERSLGANLHALHRELQDGTYRPQPYYSFIVHEPKRRVIYAPAFRDLVAQHAIYRVVGPVFERTFIDQSFACRKGYGTHRAADYAQTALQACPRASYTLKLDVRKFFYRIDRGVLRGLIECKMKDARLIDVMMMFADHGESAGIPIGNLLSQLYALIYLNPLDHFVKRVLKVRWYCRYVDDFVLFGLTRERALECRAQIVEFLAGLKLELSKSTLSRATKGVNFVGFRTWATRRFIRKHSLYRFRRSVRDERLESAISILGHARRTASYRHLLATAGAANRPLYDLLPKALSRTHRC